MKLNPPNVGHTGCAGYINLYAYKDQVLKMETLTLAYQPILAIRTYHDEKTKNKLLSNMLTTERTNVEWKRMRKSDLA